MKKIGVSMIFISLIIFSACAKTPTSTEKASIYNISYELDDKGIRIDVKGRNAYFLAILSDSNNNTYDKASISEAELIDGMESMWIRYPESPGDYYLVILRNGKIIHEKKISFKGAELNIINIDTETEKDWWFSKDKFVFYVFNMTIENKGDLPAYIRRIKFKFSDKSGTYRIDERIAPGEIKTIGSNRTAIFHYDHLTKGKYQAIISIYFEEKQFDYEYGNEKVATFQKQFVIGQS